MKRLNLVLAWAAASGMTIISAPAVSQTSTPGYICNRIGAYCDVPGNQGYDSYSACYNDQLPYDGYCPVPCKNLEGCNGDKGITPSPTYPQPFTPGGQ